VNVSSDLSVLLAKQNA